MQRIIDPRMGSMPHRNLRMFAELTGPGSAKNVVLITTMWDTLGRNRADLGNQREERLKKEYWNVMIEHGATTERFLNHSDSAWNIIDKIFNKNSKKTALRFQEERVDQKRPLKETGAGKTLNQKPDEKEE
jgi:hypothetical protein